MDYFWSKIAPEAIQGISLAKRAINLKYTSKSEIAHIYAYQSIHSFDKVHNLFHNAILNSKDKRLFVNAINKEAIQLILKTSEQCIMSIGMEYSDIDVTQKGLEYDRIINIVNEI